MSETMSISNEPEKRGYGELIESLPKGSRLIMVIGENEEQPWIRAGVNPEIKVFGETQFAAEWPAHAAENADAHIWISAAVDVAPFVPFGGASITYEADHA
jgi:hypothetical protein